ncbi:MAG TPA: Trk system potassium transporter TrkA [Candidatus Scatomorpha merdipullorum]|uniref:Trk system potassium uptake protein TrkA n=1 Tax=Candidatus Scatomorpha merdipullorum TaxID=2840927 RepID=A0A9D1JUR3_9FIRM|nr:Trk system potassium transporter TrkA [Candidatus Scatomorpha merdipullorum]
MNIVLVGAGRMGGEIAIRLADEGHDITVVDSDAERLEQIANTVDAMTLLGNGADYSVLSEAGVADADLLIAVTNEDAVNMLCCLSGKKLGVKNTVARVRTMEYFQQMVFLKDELGLSLVLNPEQAAAAEISRILRFPSAAKVDSFAKGRAEMVEHTVEAGSPLCSLRLDRLRSKHGGILIAVVERGEDVFIPRGDFVLQEGDAIHVVGSPNAISGFFKGIGCYKRSVRDVMLLGGGRISLYLGAYLMGAGIRVKIMERDEQHCETIKEILPKAEVLLGDGTDPKVLVEEGIRSADAFVALTGSDQNNIITSMFAQREGVGKVIVKVNEDAFRIMAGSQKLDSFVLPKNAAAEIVVSYVRAMQHSINTVGIESLHDIAYGKAEVLEFSINGDAPNLGVPIKELDIRRDTLIAAIIRNNQCIIPGGSDTMEKNDTVIAVTTKFGMKGFADIFED